MGVSPYTSNLSSVGGTPEFPQMSFSEFALQGKLVQSADEDFLSLRCGSTNFPSTRERAVTFNGKLVDRRGVEPLTSTMPL